MRAKRKGRAHETLTYVPPTPSPPSPFDGMSDEQLREELKRREEDRKQARLLAKTERDAAFVKLLQDKEAGPRILNLLFRHNGPSCSDENPHRAYIDHGVPRCPRCYAVACTKDNYWEIEIDFEITLSPWRAEAAS